MTEFKPGSWGPGVTPIYATKGGKPKAKTTKTYRSSWAAYKPPKPGIHTLAERLDSPMLLGWELEKYARAVAPKHFITVNVLEKEREGSQVGLCQRTGDNSYRIHINPQQLRKLYRESWLNGTLPFEQVLLGVFLHEVAHAKYDSLTVSQPKSINDAQWERYQMGQGGLFDHIWNIVDDARVEYTLSKDNIGLARFIGLAVSVLHTHWDIQSALQEQVNLLQTRGYRDQWERLVEVQDAAAYLQQRVDDLFQLCRFGVVRKEADPAFISFALPLVLAVTRGGADDAVLASCAIFDWIMLRLKRETDQPQQGDQGDEQQPGDGQRQPGSGGSGQGQGQQQPGQGSGQSQPQQPEHGRDPQDGERSESKEQRYRDLQQMIQNTKRQQQANQGQGQGQQGQDQRGKAQGQQMMETGTGDVDPSQVMQELAKGDPTEMIPGMQAGKGGEGLQDTDPSKRQFLDTVLDKKGDLIQELRDTFKRTWAGLKIVHTTDPDDEMNDLRLEQIYEDSFLEDPRHNWKRYQRKAPLIDLVIARDVSGSTHYFQRPYAEATAVVLASLEALPGVRTGLIDFNGEAKTVKRFEESLDFRPPFPYSAGGTELGPALENLEADFMARDRADKYLFVVTDGYWGDPDTADVRLKRLEDEGWTVVRMHVSQDGSEGGAGMARVRVDGLPEYIQGVVLNKKGVLH